MSEIALLDGFPVVFEAPVQWGDQDAFGHVNNTVYFRWLESARIAYLERIGMSHDRHGSEPAPILASIKCDYRRQLNFPDRVRVGARVSRIGRSSFLMQHQVVSDNLKAVVAEGEGTIVAFNYLENKSCPVPDDLRRAIEKLEGRKF